MKIIKPFTLGVLQRPYPFLGRNRLAVAALGFFPLGADCERLLDDNRQWPLLLPLLPAGAVLDEVMPKPHGEALVLGGACAPGGVPVPSMCVRLQVGAIDKSLCVSGDREWRYGLMPWYRVSDPVPFARMPIDAAHAYGGPGHPANPGGIGYVGRVKRGNGAMPNLEYPCRPVRSHWRHLAPAGFGPIAAHCAPRAGKYGTYGARWLAHEAPGFASDIDWSAFNVAPADQWLPGYFSGGESYRLEGMHPARPVIEGSLPRMRARAFMLARGAAPDACVEIALRLDTVWFLPEQELGILVFHGEHDIADSDGLDVGTLMVGYEALGQPKPLEHYRQVLAWRGDTATAALHAFDESQLAPAFSTATEARRDADEQAAQAAALAQRQQRIDLLDAEYWDKLGRAAPPGHTPPRATPPAPQMLSASAVKAGDFNLTEMVEHAKAQVEQVRQAGAARLAALPPAPAAVPDPEQQFAAALQRAIVPAYDLFPLDQTGRDPRAAGQAAQLAAARDAGQLDEPRYQQALRALEGRAALQRSARRAAHKVAGEPPLPSTALRLGQQARAWLADGIALAGRDLAGAMLDGAMLDGADLRETMLEGASLRHASLRGADLRGAVLSGAMLGGADFSGALLDGANLCGSSAPGTLFYGASLRKARADAALWPCARLDDANLDDALLMNIDLGGAVLDRVHARGTVLIKARAEGSRWREATLDRVVALRASLARADFRGASVRSTAVIEADLSGSDWQGAAWDHLQGACAGTNWRGARLCGVRAVACGLQGASLAGADLRAAHFLRCDLGACDLDGARLDNAHFPHTNLMAATLRGASAGGADFYEAICRKADFTGAQLAGARFVRAEKTGMLVAPAGSCT
jgi:uncharacterized protein YjbI with pentapeptide repeats